MAPIVEIGSVFDQSAEGKKHLEVCPRCLEGFRRYVQGLGATPADFGQADWTAVKPVLAGGPKATTYYTRKFNNYATAKLFADLAAAFDAQNAKKRRSLAQGEKGGPAPQPWIYSYALRDNTFLMGGHSLDFFDFYRDADNAFVYEMSNRGWQIWQWASYLCDVGRVVSERMGKRFGIYVKPHRGAPVQRSLSAVARGAKMLYWYTYGPDYFKGDSFSDNLQTITLPKAFVHDRVLVKLIQFAKGIERGKRPARIGIHQTFIADCLPGSAHQATIYVIPGRGIFPEQFEITLGL